jgi:hypothetical protein
MDYPLTVKNPLTNQIIVGEVEFYLIQKNVIESQMQIFRSDENHPKIISAHYIGSDYTYAYSQKFRDSIFRDNTLDENLLIGVSARLPEGP